jgi:hypothetical protein
MMTISLSSAAECDTLIRLLENTNSVVNGKETLHQLKEAKKAFDAQYLLLNDRKAEINAFNNQWNKIASQAVIEYKLSTLSDKENSKNLANPGLVKKPILQTSASATFLSDASSSASSAKNSNPSIPSNESWKNRF